MTSANYLKIIYVIWFQSRYVESAISVSYYNRAGSVKEKYYMDYWLTIYYDKNDREVNIIVMEFILHLQNVHSIR